MSWIISGKSDPDFEAYIAAVEAADSATLEVTVRQAYYNFIVGCKTDGIWDAIKASCILAGARTLNGALVPLVGTAPTNFNFVAGDYDRKIGLVGNGSTKYLDANRALNADPQNDAHAAVWASSIGNTSPLIAHNDWVGTGSTGVGYGGSRNRSTTANGITVVTGINAVSRSTSGSFDWQHGASSGSTSATSETPPADNYWIFRGDVGVTKFYGTHRLAFYSIGESLDLALLNTRVTTLMSDLAAAIP